jgi:hypothetical protein
VSGWPVRPYCECGNCDATGNGGGDPILLPEEAWSVAGEADLHALAVVEGHEAAWEDDEHEVIQHDGWAEVRTRWDN